MDDPIVCDFVTSYAFICALLRESAGAGLSVRDLRLLCRNARLVFQRANEPAARRHVRLLVEARIVQDLEHFVLRMEEFLAYMSDTHASDLDPERIARFREWFVLPEPLKHVVRASIISSAQTSLPASAYAS